MQGEGGCPVIRRGTIYSCGGPLPGGAPSFSWLAVQGCAREPRMGSEHVQKPPGSRGTPKPPGTSEHAHPKRRPPKRPDAGERGPSACRGARIPRMTYPAAPRAACSPAPTDQTNWTMRSAMTRYAVLVGQTISTEGWAATSSTAGMVTTSLTGSGVTAPELHSTSSETRLLRCRPGPLHRREDRLRGQQLRGEDSPANL
jgi:hypothetical protein